MRVSAARLASWCGGRVAGDETAVVTSFSHDSRAVAPGSCFVALRGHRDGHDFVGSAFAAGATAALVSATAALEAPAAGRALIRVEDPLGALAEVARAARALLGDLAVVAITGSSGKTSTKDLLAAAVGGVRAVHSSAESFNNEIGLPLTVLGAAPTTDVLVVEMGARFPGNIAQLCAVARPTIGIVTNVGLAHAEHLGGPEGVAAVKGELVEALPGDGLAVLYDDDQATSALASRSAAPVLRVGSSARADVRIVGAHLDDELRPAVDLATPWGQVAVRLAVRGEHQVANAALAVAAALALGVPRDDVVEGIGSATGSRWRLQLERSPGGISVLNDSYNANPESMAAAIRALARFPTTRRRIAVLGEMRELGEHALDAHAAVGRLLDDLGIDELVAVGRGGALIASTSSLPTHHVDDARAALRVLHGVAGGGDVVLVKASRAVGLEHVAAGLVAGTADDAAVRSAADPGGEARR